MFKIIKIFLCFTLVSLSCSGCGHNVMPMDKFTASDRILILAPHPDDETIGAGGVIQKALKAGAEVKVVCFTKGRLGSSKTMAKRTLSQKEIMDYGKKRRLETVEAMKIVGIDDDDIVFLGYPDGNTKDILIKHWDPSRPYKTTLTHMEKVSDDRTYSPGAPFIGQSILKDLESIVLTFKPTKVFVSHPADMHRDHRALYVFLKVALLDLNGQIRQPEVFCYLVHITSDYKWFLPDSELNPPSTFRNTRFFWKKLPLTRDEISTKTAMISEYKSQLTDVILPLYIFSRKNELFGDYPILKIREAKTDKNKKFKLGNEIKTKIVTNGFIKSISYKIRDGNLLIKIISYKNMDRRWLYRFSLLPYSKTVDFDLMPKIHLIIGYSSFIAEDKGRPIPVKGIALNRKGKVATIKIPLSMLQNPDYIFNTSAIINEGRVSRTAWRVLKLE